MRRYENEPERKLIKVVCNQCQRELKVENGYLKEGCFHADVSFGYFSHKDGTRQQFDLCEECFDKLAAQLAIPVEESQNNELM